MSVRDTLDTLVQAERQRAVRALLQRPLLTAVHHADDLMLVRRHQAVLRRFFQEDVGWALEVQREVVRLRKAPATSSDGTRGARARRQDPPFSRRRYVLLCLCLAALHESDRQTTLKNLAERVAGLVAQDPALGSSGIDFELKGRAQRLALVAAVRWLIAHGVLTRVEGAEEAFVNERGDVLYRVDRVVLGHVLITQVAPSMVDEQAGQTEPANVQSLGARVAALTPPPARGSDELRRRSLRHRVMRGLLDDPVLYFDELSDEEQDYLVRSRAALGRKLEEMTGLAIEVRAEGIALVDPRGDATDLALPEEGTDGHLTLLLAEYLTERGRKAPGTPIAIAELEQHVCELVKVYGKHWRKAARAKGAEVGLVEHALLHLEGLRLVRRVSGGVVPRPAVGRYAIVEAEVSGSAQENLF